MLEVSYDPIGDGYHVFPQVIVTEDGPQLRGDGHEIETFGLRAFSDLFQREMLTAFREFKDGNKRALIPESIPSRFIPKGQKFSPRIYARGTISQVERGKTLIARYRDDEGPRRLFHALSNWPKFKRFTKASFSYTSTIAGLLLIYDDVKIARALVKL